MDKIVALEYEVLFYFKAVAKTKTSDNQHIRDFNDTNCLIIG